MIWLSQLGFCSFSSQACPVFFLEQKSCRSVQGALLSSRLYLELGKGCYHPLPGLMLPPHVCHTFCNFWAQKGAATATAAPDTQLLGGCLKMSCKVRLSGSITGRSVRETWTQQLPEFQAGSLVPLVPVKWSQKPKTPDL